MRATRRTPHVPTRLDIVRPSQLFRARPTSSAHDPRRWLRLVLLTLAGASAMLPLLGATKRALGS